MYEEEQTTTLPAKSILKELHISSEPILEGWPEPSLTYTRHLRFSGVQEVLEFTNVGT